MQTDHFDEIAKDMPDLPEFDECCVLPLPEEVAQTMQGVDPDALLEEERKKTPHVTAICDTHYLKLNYFPTLEEILGTPSPAVMERVEKAADLTIAKQVEEEDHGSIKAQRNATIRKWKNAYLELKRREVVVAEFYRRRYENEMKQMREELNALKLYLGKFDPSRRYPSANDLERAVSQYFDACDQEEQAYTVPDLLLFLRINKQHWRGYLEKGPETYSVVAEMAMLKIEGQRNRQLLTGKGQMSGHIADLGHHFEWNKKRDEDIPKSVTNNMVIMGAPPQPESIEQWAEWYQKTIGGKRSDELQSLPDGNASGVPIDVTPLSTPRK